MQFNLQKKTYFTAIAYVGLLHFTLVKAAGFLEMCGEACWGEKKIEKAQNDATILSKPRQKKFLVKDDVFGETMVNY